MRWLTALIAMLFLSGACTPRLNTARRSGRKGKHYPQLLDKSGRVRFSIAAPGATLVTIAGSFNGWNSDYTKLTRAQGSDVWSVVLKLKLHHNYSYKYLVDGHWIPDPANPRSEPDGFGGINSVIKFVPEKKGAKK